MANDGYFSLSNKAIDALLKCNPPAEVFLSLLVLGKNTGAFNKYSFASSNAIKTILGVNRDKANSYIEALLHICKSDNSKILMYPDVSRVKVGKSYNRIKTRWMLDPKFNGVRDSPSFFSNDLVSKVPNYKNSPIRVLKKFYKIDAAVRTLFHLHKEFSFELNGLPPHANFYDYYACQDSIFINDYKIIISKRESSVTFSEDLDRYLAAVLKTPTVASEKTSISRMMQKVLVQLERKGFIHKSIMVFDGHPSKPDSRPIYELDVKSPKGNGQRIAEEIEPILRNFEEKAAHGQSLYKFYDKYAAIIPKEMDAHIVGIYRPVYMVKNKRVLQVQALEVEEAKRRSQAKEWVMAAHDSLGLARVDGKVPKSQSKQQVCSDKIA